jgi:hypothetical protein
MTFDQPIPTTRDLIERARPWLSDLVDFVEALNAGRRPDKSSRESTGSIAELRGLVADFEAWLREDDLAAAAASVVVASCAVCKRAIAAAELPTLPTTEAGAPVHPLCLARADGVAVEVEPEAVTERRIREASRDPMT